jgi:Arc/MetJ-type ribon-helix-helix transcriptional regulator
MPEKGYKSVTLPDTLINEVKKVVQKSGEYTGQSDFIKDSIRRNLDRVKRKGL